MTKQLRDLVLEKIVSFVTPKELGEIRYCLDNFDDEEMAFLDALKQCGVDNWEGYSEAWKLMKEWGYE